MSIIIWLLTFVLVITCLFLILLVLVQLPKKEAGLGQAFGSGATDALFGPGSGNMLTKLTKYAAGIFFALTILVWVLYGHNARAKSGDLRSKLTAAEKEELTPAPKTPPPQPTITNLSLLTGTNAGTNVVLTNKATNVAPANPPK